MKCKNRTGVDLPCNCWKVFFNKKNITRTNAALSIFHIWFDFFNSNAIEIEMTADITIIEFKLTTRSCALLFDQI
jgi:hypothetical protein